MSSHSPQLRNSSVLGESWVVPDLPPKRTHGERVPGTVDDKGNDSESGSLAESHITSTSSGSAPELIMPSISVDMTSEGSWVVPRKQNKQVVFRKQSMASSADSQKGGKKAEQSKGSAGPSIPIANGIKDRLRGKISYLARDLGRSRVIFLLVNAMLLIPISHLLILPELLYQFPQLCQLPFASTLYPDNCVFHNDTYQKVPGLPANYQHAIAAQIQLQDFLNQTVQALIPLDNPLRHGERELRQAYNTIRNTYPGVRHELDLEFEGTWAALRTSSREFDTLKSEMKSTVDNLLSQQARRRTDPRVLQGKSPNEEHFWSRILSHSSQTGVEKGNLLARQLNRLEQFLDTAISRLSSRTDSFLINLATLDDHLESIQRIVRREEQRRLGSSEEGRSKIVEYLASFWSTLRDRYPFLSSDAGLPESSDMGSPDSGLSGELCRMSAHHHPISNIVGKLDKELKALQKIRAIRV
jgi:hypothetical protein